MTQLKNLSDAPPHRRKSIKSYTSPPIHLRLRDYIWLALCLLGGILELIVFILGCLISLFATAIFIYLVCHYFAGSFTLEELWNLTLNR